ncbi:MAG: hypothetical protein RBG1_1C00001G0902 [candidate division Zixibacteria bacterium RBG-1]|nr:MAG: hypothetical protein RBG1_1C00001G0902 [candidate division Zixibacteria bacterium RBG-1]
MNPVEFYSKIKELLEQRVSFAVATVIKSVGSTPRKTNAKMIILANGEIIDSIGGGTLEALVIKEALTALSEGKSKVCDFDLFPGGRNPSGQLCGGQMSVFIEVFEKPAQLLIFGAGHIGYYLARLAVDLDFKVVVIDTRQEYLTPERFPKGELVLADSEYKKHFPKIDSSSWVVIVNHNQELDEKVLRKVLNSKAGYIGMIGSRRKVKEFKKKLEKNFEPKILEKIYAPIGLDLGGDLPAEIAISILAQIIQLKNKK